MARIQIEHWIAFKNAGDREEVPGSRSADELSSFRWPVWGLELDALGLEERSGREKAHCLSYINNIHPQFSGSWHRLVGAGDGIACLEPCQQEME
jgi:hypothetical protein